MRRLAHATLITATSFAALVAPADAATITPMQGAQAAIVASQAFPDSPCAGHIVIVWDATLHARGRDGEALGRQFVDGRWTTVDCRVGIFPGEPERTCDVIVHEAGHLAGTDEHVPGTIMAEGASGWPACHPTPARVVLSPRALTIQTIRAMVPTRFAWRVACNRGAIVTRCTAKASGTKTRRFRVRVSKRQIRVVTDSVTYQVAVVSRFPE